MDYLDVGLFDDITSMALAILRALSDRIFSLFQRNETQFGRELQFRSDSSSSLARYITYSSDIVDFNDSIPSTLHQFAS